MTPNEITTVIASLLEREQDVPFRMKLMEQVNAWRGRLVKNRIEKNPSERKLYRQSLIVPMQKYTETCTGRCPGSVSTILIPDTLTGTTHFDYIGGTGGDTPFREVTPGTASFMNTGRFAKDIPWYEFTNRKIYTQAKQLRNIRIDAVFSNPLEVKEISCSATNTTCDPWNEPYPLAADMLQLVIQSLLEVDYRRPDLKERIEVPVNEQE